MTSNADSGDKYNFLSEREQLIKNLRDASAALEEILLRIHQVEELFEEVKVKQAETLALREGIDTLKSNADSLRESFLS